MEKRSSIHIHIGMVFVIVIIAVMSVWISYRFIFTTTRIEGMSMYPTLDNGETVIVNKVVYRSQEPQRFDIIVFTVDDKLSKTGQYVKRIIALPGERVRIDKDGIVYINGVKLDENYGYQKIENPGNAKKEFIVPDNSYFTLGDNRNHSEDSRSSKVGCISADRILGKAQIRLLPISKYGFIDLYMERTQNK